ncbi:hypothetical protein NPS01_31630 [Nocardioides psychrotolerans]|nr:hypothetical protein NPS01_31630 [Nocardioides psychrotolerans]
MRLYIPASLDLLASWAGAGEVSWPEEPILAADVDEESEYAALMTAADASAELIGGVGRRVVVVVEDGSTGHPIALRRVVAVHADVEDFTDPDDDLAWFAPQEIDQLLHG